MYTVKLQRNSDGKIVDSVQEFEWQESSEFWWSDGNMGCDCNRHLEFERALGNEPEKHYKCGITDYKILSITIPNGEVVYEEG